MTPTNKCQHDGEMITGWDEVTCRKCGWIVPSGQRIGIHDGWFPSHDAHKEFKKYRTYTGMDNTYPIDATKYDEVQNMTQTNNEREKLDVRYFNEKLRLVLEGLPNYTRSELARELQRLSNTASPISQNEQQEAVSGVFMPYTPTDEIMVHFEGRPLSLLSHDKRNRMIEDYRKMLSCSPFKHIKPSSPPKQAIPEVRVYIEHGFVCVRTETGQLLSSKKVEEFKPYDFILAAPTNTEVGE